MYINDYILTTWNNKFITEEHLKESIEDALYIYSKHKTNLHIDVCSIFYQDKKLLA